MSSRRSLALRRRWKGIPASVRSQIGRRNALRRWESVPEDDRIAYGRMMNEAKRIKSANKK